MKYNLIIYVKYLILSMMAFFRHEERKSIISRKLAEDLLDLKADYHQIWIFSAEEINVATNNLK